MILVYLKLKVENMEDKRTMNGEKPLLNSKVTKHQFKEIQQKRMYVVSKKCLILFCFALMATRLIHSRTQKPFI